MPEPVHPGPLAQIALVSDILEADEVIALVDGAINLLVKAGVAVDQGKPDDRVRALALIDRAERRLPDPASVAAAHRDGLLEAMKSVVRLRERAEALPT